MLHWPLWAPHVGLGEDFTRRRRRARPRFTVFKSLLCRDSVHTCIKFVTAAHVCSFKRHSNPLIHTGRKMVGDVWLQWSQSTALMPSPPPLPQKGPYRASLFRQNSLTFEYARNQLHGCSRTKQTSALRQHAKKRLVFFLCNLYHPISPPSPFLHFSVHPLSPHQQPRWPSPAARCSPSTRQGSAGISSTRHTCGPGSLQDAYSWGDSKSERGSGLVGGHPGRLEEVRSSCLQPLGCAGEVHAAGRAAERSLPGIR